MFTLEVAPRRAEAGREAGEIRPNNLWLPIQLCVNFTVFRDPPQRVRCERAIPVFLLEFKKNWFGVPTRARRWVGARKAERAIRRSMHQSRILAAAGELHWYSASTMIQYHCSSSWCLPFPQITSPDPADIKSAEEDINVLAMHKDVVRSWLRYLQHVAHLTLPAESRPESSLNERNDHGVSVAGGRFLRHVRRWCGRR
jgi:hypothetical protein